MRVLVVIALLHAVLTLVDAGNNERSVGLMQFSGGELLSRGGSIWGTIVWASPISSDGVDW